MKFPFLMIRFKDWNVLFFKEIYAFRNKHN